jgi:hypothetical protein
MQGSAKRSTHIMQQTVTPTDFTIISFLPRPNGSKADSASFQPHSIKRESDGEIFSIGDEVTNGTQMQGVITGFEFLENSVYVTHTWSGVGMNLGSLQKIIQLPSQFQINQVVKVRFQKDDKGLTATVRSVHFHRGKVKYDLGLWLGDGSVDDPERETRIYNVDSEFLSLA